MLLDWPGAVPKLPCLEGATTALKVFLKSYFLIETDCSSRFHRLDNGFHNDQWRRWLQMHLAEIAFEVAAKTVALESVFCVEEDLPPVSKMRERRL